MDNLVIIGIIALAAVVIIGTALKLYTSNKIKDFEGTYDSSYDSTNDAKKVSSKKENVLKK